MIDDKLRERMEEAARKYGLSESISLAEAEQRDDSFIAGAEWAFAELESAEREKEVAELVEALENSLAFHGDDPCRFDHNRNCQEHGSFGYDGGCDVADARAVLAKRRGGSDERK